MNEADKLIKTIAKGLKQLHGKPQKLFVKIIKARLQNMQDETKAILDELAEMTELQLCQWYRMKCLEADVLAVYSDILKTKDEDELEDEWAAQEETLAELQGLDDDEPLD